MKIYNYGEKKPEINPNSWIADDVVVYGDVQIEENVVVFPGGVIRGDIAPVIIKAGTVIQDGVIINPAAGNKTKIGENCLIGFGTIFVTGIFTRNFVVGIFALIPPLKWWVNGEVIHFRIETKIGSPSKVLSGWGINAQTFPAVFEIPARFKIEPFGFVGNSGKISPFASQ